MGSRMAARLAEAGHELTVWDRDSGAVAGLTARGCRAAAEPAGVARDADVVISMLWDDEVAAAVVERLLIPAARSGTTFIEMTTLTPAMQRVLAAQAAAHGCSFLDAPVTGSKDAAAGGQLTALVGGDADVLESNRDVLSAMASRIVHVGPNGVSGALKLANNQLIALMSAAWGESVAAAVSGGAERRLALDLFAETFARVAAMKCRTIAEHDYRPNFTLAALLKDLHQASRVAEAQDLELPLLRAVLPLYAEAADDGAAADDFSIIVDRITRGARAPKEARP